MEILRSIEKNIIDITNSNNDIDASKLKKDIKTYFENIVEKENINNLKRDKYYDEYENKRVEQNINYDNYLREKAELMESFKINKNKTALHNYLKLKPPVYDKIELYSYLDIKVEEAKPVVRQEAKPVVKQEAKPVVKQVDKCTSAKIAECEKKGKKCNPDSGRCVKADNLPTKVEDKPPAKVEEKPPAKVEEKPPAKVEEKPPAKVEEKPPAKVEDKPPAKEDKCTPAKIAECEIKGKKCNPDSGRCIKK